MRKHPMSHILVDSAGVSVHHLSLPGLSKSSLRGNMLRRAILAFPLLTCLFAGSVAGRQGQLSASLPTTEASKNISFACAPPNGVYLCSPKWTEDWVKKNVKKFAGIHFSQSPVSGAENYLIVLSTSTSALSGFQPVVRWNTTRSTADVSGRGTADDDYGSTWTYTYHGTATTTTMTTTQEDVPYTVETITIYASAYGGPLNSLVAQNSESTVRREGGDPDAAVVTNLGGLIRRIRIKTRLLDGVVKDIAKLPSSKTQVEAPSEVQGVAPLERTTVHLTSSPSGGEIYVDGKFVGNTPSDIAIAAGEHTVKVTIGGKEWSRSIQITSGEISLHAEIPAEK
jgi:hypothetical protein